MLQQCERPSYWVDFLREAEIDPETGEQIAAAPIIYEPVDGMEELRERLEVRMTTYNEASENKTRKLSLVLFDAAIKHVVRILKQAGEDVRVMQDELREKEKTLQVASKETDALVVESTEQKAQANKKAAEVGAVKSRLAEDAGKVQVVKEDAEADLALAQPMLEAATKALDSIDPKALQT
eukprot:gene4417-40795_t